MTGFVRTARSGDGAAVAAVQAAALAGGYATLLPPGATFDEAAAAQAWEQACARPPSPEHRVFLARPATGEEVVAFAALGPGSDPDLAAEVDLNVGAMAVLHVRPGATRQGHGSRLLAACTDHAAAFGWDGLSTWVIEDDEPLRSLLRASGWEPDGASRVLDDAVTQRRWRVWLP